MTLDIYSTTSPCLPHDKCSTDPIGWLLPDALAHGAVQCQLVVIGRATLIAVDLKRKGVQDTHPRDARYAREPRTYTDNNLIWIDTRTQMDTRRSFHTQASANEDQSLRIICYERRAAT